MATSLDQVVVASNTCMKGVLTFHSYSIVFCFGLALKINYWPPHGLALVGTSYKCARRKQVLLGSALKHFSDMNSFSINCLVI